MTAQNVQLHRLTILISSTQQWDNAFNAQTADLAAIKSIICNISEPVLVQVNNAGLWNLRD